jgi:hypothetical protein
MTFWLGVAVAYTLIIAVGLALGVTLAHRHPGNGRGRWDVPDEWTPTPTPAGGKTLDDELAELVAGWRS